jgi:hypothetical protein
LTTRFFSLAPNLVDEGGHDMIYHECVEKAATLIASQTYILTAKNCLIERDNWTPFFTAYQSSKIKHLFVRMQEFLNLFSNRGGDIFFLESFTLTDLLALTFAFILKGKRRTKIAVVIRSDLHQLKMRGVFHKFLFSLLRSKATLFLFTDSEIIQKAIPSYLLPIPHTEPPSCFGIKGNSYLWWPGTPRLSKGLNEIQHLASQLTEEHQIEVTLAETTPITFSTPHIRKILHPLPRPDYLSELHRCTGVLLPYDPAIYRGGTSGIFVEAIIAGKMPFVKEGTWMAHELRKFNLPELILDWESSDLPIKIAQLLKSDQLLSKLSLMMENYRSFHSQDRFASILQETLSC